MTVLGTSTLAVGLIDGVPEATLSITKISSGDLSDWLRRLKGFAVLRYGLPAIPKSLFPLETGVSCPEDGVALPLGDSDSGTVGAGCSTRPRIRAKIGRRGKNAR